MCHCAISRHSAWRWKRIAFHDLEGTHNMPTWDVLGVGAVAVDDLVYLDGYPAPDTKMLVQEEPREGGGLAATAMVAAARLGARAAYAGVLGDDDLSRFSIAELERSGVDCSLVQRRPGARPIHSTVLVDRLTGQRTILHSRAGGGYHRLRRRVLWCVCGSPGPRPGVGRDDQTGNRRRRIESHSPRWAPRHPRLAHTRTIHTGAEPWISLD